MLNKWMRLMCPIFSKHGERMCEEKKSSWKPIFSTSKLQHVAGSVNLLCHLVVGACLTVICYDNRGALTYVSFLTVTSPMSLSHTTFLLNTSEEPLSEKTQKKIGERTGSVSEHWTEPFQEFKLQLLMIAVSTSWAPFCFWMSSKEYTS